jgi:hypothetical protein
MKRMDIPVLDRGRITSDESTIALLDMRECLDDCSPLEELYVTTKGIAYNQFVAAGLPPSVYTQSLEAGLAQAYALRASARSHRPTAAYIINDQRDGGGNHVVGVASFENGSTSRLRNLREDRTRAMAGWVTKQELQKFQRTADDDLERYAHDVVRTLIHVASSIGIEKLTAHAVNDRRAIKPGNPVFPICIPDVLDGLDFKFKGSSTLKVGGREYKGGRWALDVTETELTFLAPTPIMDHKR